MRDYSDIFAKAFSDFAVPSLSAAVYENGEVRFFNFGIADHQVGTCPTEHTRYLIGSTSKSFIATAINLLAAEGKMSLDDRVTELLPDFRFFSDVMDREITVRKILSHQTGLPRHDISWVNNPSLTLSQMVGNIHYLEPAFDVGERFHYQNHMYALASVLVEKVSGMPWTEFVRKRITDPLGMKDTLLSTKSFGENDTFARPYALREGKNVPFTIWPLDNIGSAGCIVSSASDMIQWMICHLKKGNGLFNDLADHEMHRVQMPIREYEMYPYSMSELDISASGYGMGWFVETFRDHTLISHGGTVSGFKSACGYLPEHDFAYVIFANLDYTQAVNAAQFNLVSRALDLPEKDYGAKILAAQKTAADRSGQQLAQLLESISGPCTDTSLAGNYVHPAYGRLKLEAVNGSLRVWIGNLCLAILDTDSGSKVVDAREEANMIAPLTVVCENGVPKAIDIVLEPMIKHGIHFSKE